MSKQYRIVAMIYLWQAGDKHCLCHAVVEVASGVGGFLFPPQWQDKSEMTANIRAGQRAGYTVVERCEDGETYLTALVPGDWDGERLIAVFDALIEELLPDAQAGLVHVSVSEFLGGRYNAN